MRLSAATSLGAGDLFTRLETIAAAGFTGIELSETDLIGFGGTPEEIGKRAASLGLNIDAFRYTHEFDCLSGKDRKKAIASLEHQLDLNQALGTTTLVVALAMSAHSNRFCNDTAVCDELAYLTERADSRNQRVALNALPWSCQYQTEMKALELIETVNHSALGLALSSYYSLSCGLQPARLRSIPGERLFHVQLSDGPVLDSDVSQLNDQFSMLPGQGDLPLVSFVRIIARLGYAGSWSLACANDKPSYEKHNYVKDGFRALVTLLDEAARYEPVMLAPIPDLPARVYPTGFEFIEFSVDEESCATLTERLESLCFRKERHHVSKSVQLWRQGAINILINSETKGFASEAFAKHGPTVCDMALRVRDANQTVARATRLGTPEFFQPVAAGELDIPAIRGVGGNIVHFIDEKSDLHRLWDVEFDAVPKTRTIPPAGLRRIDHVAQTMRYHEMQSWLTYYTTTFKMKKTTVVDVADPCGVIHSQAIASPEGEVRLNLNGSEEHDTFAGTFLADQSGAGVQHIAFLTDDIFESSDHLTRAGLSRLSIPDNYYDDLKVHFNLDGKLITQMQKSQILYDRDGDGEYFQIYSTPIFQGFFFEIVERRGGYEGYGARNASVRLASQIRFMQERQIQ